jgi:hypothetical protein
MSSASTAWKSLYTNVREHWPQLGLAVRVTSAAVLAFALSHLLDVPLPLWTALTAVILTQVTFGRSVKATVDDLVGAVGGAICAGAVSDMIPHADVASLAAVLAIAAFMGAIFPRTLSRLRHDLVMLGQAAAEPLPDALEARLGPLVIRIGERGSDHLPRSGPVGSRRDNRRLGRSQGVGELLVQVQVHFQKIARRQRQPLIQ